MATNSKNNNSKTGTSKKMTISKPMQSSQLMKLFEDELKDIYWAEKKLTQAIPKMIKNASSPELVKALTNHLGETQKQVTRLEKVFKSIGKKAVAKKCEAMAGLTKEADEIMKDTEKGSMRDAGIISAGQKVEHYEIASYGTLRQFAETLGLSEAANLLEETLNEEKAADEKLSEVATSAINVEASREPETKSKNNNMNGLFKGLLAGGAAAKWGGGCFGTIVVFVIVWLLLGQTCS